MLERVIAWVMQYRVVVVLNHLPLIIKSEGGKTVMLSGQRARASFRRMSRRAPQRQQGCWLATF